MISILPPVPKPAPKEFNADHRDPEILYVGQLLRGKGVDAMLRALAGVRRPTGELDYW